MLSDVCERLHGQAARSEQKDKRNKAADVPLLNGNKATVVSLLNLLNKSFSSTNTIFQSDL